MSDSSTAQYIIILILVLLSGFFSATETAFSSVNKIRIRNYVNSGDKRAIKVLKIIENYDKALSAILIGNNIVNIASASLGTIIFTNMFGANGVGIATIVMTILVLIFGEILPKTFVKENAEKFSLFVVNILSFTMFILSPIVYIFVCLKNIIYKLFIKEKKSKPSVTEQELKYIIEEIQDEGVLEKQEGELVQSALDFDEITANEILTPRVDIIAIDINDSIEKIKDIFITQKYSRIPVFEKSIDNIIGILHEKEFFKFYIENKENKNVNLSNLIQKTIYIPPKKKISELLRELQKEKLHLAVVSDEYGGTQGIITLEDILEELVGEIWDEADEVEQSIIKISDSSYKVSADMNIYDMFEKLDITYNDFESTSNTVSGWILETFEKIPQEGEFFEYKNIKVTIKTLEEQRIIDVIIDIN